MPHIKLLIAIALLACLLPMPYGYYMLVRFVCTFVFGYFAYNYFNKQNSTLALTFLVSAVIFQPFYKFVLGRAGWNLIDIVMAGILLYLYYKEYLKHTL